jgi:hypothetical protein
MSWLLLNLVQYKQPGLVQAALSLLRESSSIRYNLLRDLGKVDLMMKPKQFNVIVTLKEHLSRIDELTPFVSLGTVRG